MATILTSFKDYNKCGDCRYSARDTSKPMGSLMFKCDKTSESVGPNTLACKQFRGHWHD